MTTIGSQWNLFRPRSKYLIVNLNLLSVPLLTKKKEGKKHKTHLKGRSWSDEKIKITYENDPRRVRRIFLHPFLI